MEVITLENLTPMMKQYITIKEKYPDTILFLDLEIFMRCFLMMPLWLLKN